MSNTDAELAEIGDADLERYTAEQNRPLNAAELKRLDCIAEHLTSRDMEDAEIVWRAMRTIERLSSQAPLQFLGTDTVEGKRIEEAVAHAVGRDTAKCALAAVRAALATPRGEEGSQTP